MAARVTPPATPPGPAGWNPLACSGTGMRPNALLMAKLYWLLLALGAYWQNFNGPFVAGAGWLAAIPGLGLIAALAFWLGGLFLLFNRGVRVAAGMIGAVVLLLPYASVTAWRPHAWVAGAVLILCALQGPGEQPRLVRAFMLLVHAAALLGAMQGAGWVGTALGAPWHTGDFVGALPRWLARHIGTDTLRAGLQGLTIGLSAAVILGLVVPQARRLAAGLAVAGHVALHLALGNRETALFAGAIAIGHISALDWPRRMIALWPRACGWPLWLRIALDRYDFDHRTDWPRPPDPDAHLEAWFDGRRKTGLGAVIQLALFLPAFHFTLFALLATIHLTLPPFTSVPLNAGIATVLLALSVCGGRPGRRQPHRSRRSPVPNDPPPPPVEDPPRL